MPRIDRAWTRALPDYAPDVRWVRAGRELAVATQAGPVMFLDAASGEVLRQAEGHVGGALALAECPVAPCVATGGHDGDVALHGYDRDEPAVRVHAGDAWVTRLAWSDDGEVLGVAVGRAVRFYSRQGEALSEPIEHPSTVTDLRWHAATRSWLSTAYGVLNFVRPSGIVDHRYFRTSLLSIESSHDGRYLASGTQDPLAHVWDLRDESQDVNLTGYQGKVTVLAWSPRAPLLATASGPNVIAWDFGDADPSRRPRVVECHASRVSALAFTPAGQLLAGAESGALVLLDLAAPPGSQALARCGPDEGSVCTLRVDARGRFAIASIAGGELRAYALVAGDAV